MSLYGEIPTWEECRELAEAIENGLPKVLDPIQQMIFNNEPSNPNHAEGFRNDLQKVINYMEEI